MSGRRNKGGGGGHGGGGEERWLLPYADMITLLLGLFIVLFAMSTLDAKKFENVKRSLSQVFNGQITTESGDVLDGSQSVLDPTSTSQPPSQQSIQRAVQSRQASQKQYEEQAEQLKKVAAQAGLSAKDIKIDDTERGLVINIAGDALFESGSWELRPGVKTKLRRLERQLASFNRELEIVGHTDGAPYQTVSGNWELGAYRALAVLKFFLAQDYPGTKMKATSAADTEPVVKPKKGHEHDSIAANRRIEILVLAPAAKVPGTPTQKIVDLAMNPAISGAPPVENPASLDLIGELSATAKGSQG
jgi:chemotaxis protein MotB